MKEAGQGLQNQSGEGKESGEELRQRTAPNRRVRTDKQDSASSSAADQNDSTQDASTTSGAEKPRSGQGKRRKIN